MRGTSFAAGLLLWGASVGAQPAPAQVSLPPPPPPAPTAAAIDLPETAHPAAPPEQGPIPVMSLPEVLAYTRAHQPEIRRARAVVALRQREAQVPRAAWYPQLAATAQLLAGTTNNTTASPLNVYGLDLPRIGGTPVTGSTSWSPAASTLAAVGGHQELYDFGRIAAQAAAADALTDVARADAARVLLDLLLQAEEAFDAVLAARGIQTASQEAEKRATAHFDYADAGVRSGMRPPVDRTRAQAEVANATVQLTRAQNGLQLARAGLAAAIGGEFLEVDVLESTGPLPAAPAFDEALRLAQARSPEVLAALSQILAQHETTKAIGRELLPQLYLSGTLSGRAGGAAPTSGAAPAYDGFLPSVGNWHLGAVLDWPFLDFTVLARRRASQAREAVAKAGLAVARMDATLLLERAYLNLVTAQKVLPDLARAVTAARANLDQMEARFRAGLGTILDITDAENLLVTAQINLAAGRFQVARARAQLARAMGDSADTSASRSTPTSGSRP